MIPGNACEYGNMRFVEMKLGSPVEHRSEVLIAFEHGNPRFEGKFNLFIKTFNLLRDNIIRFNSAFFQYKQDHGCSGCFSMTSTHHNARFTACLLKEVFGEGVNMNAEFFGAD